MDERPVDATHSNATARPTVADRLGVFIREFWLFGLKQAQASLFGGAFLGLILATTLWYPDSAPLYRYDFLFLAAIAIQVILVALRLETLEEAKVIFLFHAVGTVMELFKTQVGSWTYPDESLIRLGAVPLFSGFMYSAVGSYIARATRLFDLRYSHFPPRAWTMVLASLIYANFFLHHYIIDMRIGLYLLTVVLFARTRVYFTVDKKPRWMPLLLGFGLVALFIWFAENVGTFGRIWVYPHQMDGFSVVKPEKIGAWFLLMIISFVLVTIVHPPKDLDRDSRA